MKIGSKVKILCDLDGIHCEGCEGIVTSISKVSDIIFLIEVKFINNKNKEETCKFFKHELEVLK